MSQQGPRLKGLGQAESLRSCQAPHQWIARSIYPTSPCSRFQGLHPTSVSANLLPMLTVSPPPTRSAMKSLLLAALPLVALPALGAWDGVVKAEANGNAQYVDWGTLKVEGNLRRVWTMVDMKTAFPDGTRSIRMFKEFDCTKIQSRRLQSVGHAAKMGKGEFTSSSATPGSWEFQEPKSGGEKMLRAVCKREPAAG